jgi:glycerophosphoryl diester phosphodiesterase
MITAHSGCDNTTPNSMEGIKAALNKNVDIIEFDLRLYKNMVYLSHDEVDGNQLDRYVTFQEALKHLEAKEVKLNCDLKEKGVFEYALKDLCEYGMEERAIFTGDYDNSKINNDAKYRYFLNVEREELQLYNNIIEDQDADKIIDYFLNSDDSTFAAWNMNYRIISPTAQVKFYTSGIPISYWTVDDPKEIDRLFQNKVYSITTNNIAYAVEARERIQGV